LFISRWTHSLTTSINKTETEQKKKKQTQREDRSSLNQDSNQYANTSEQERGSTQFSFQPFGSRRRHQDEDDQVGSASWETSEFDSKRNQDNFINEEWSGRGVRESFKEQTKDAFRNFQSDQNRGDFSQYSERGNFEFAQRCEAEIRGVSESCGKIAIKPEGKTQANRQKRQP